MFELFAGALAVSPFRRRGRLPVGTWSAGSACLSANPAQAHSSHPARVRLGPGAANAAPVQSCRDRRVAVADGDRVVSAVRVSARAQVGWERLFGGIGPDVRGRCGQVVVHGNRHEARCLRRGGWKRGEGPWGPGESRRADCFECFTDRTCQGTVCVRRGLGRAGQPGATAAGSATARGSFDALLLVRPRLQQAPVLALVLDEGGRTMRGAVMSAVS